MDANLIKVFTIKDKEYLLANGCTLLSEDMQNMVFTFCLGNQTNMCFDLSNVDFVKSDTLTF